MTKKTSLSHTSKATIHLYLSIKSHFIKQIILSILLLGCTYSGMCQDIFLGTSKDQISNYYLMTVTHKKDGISEVFERIRPQDGKLPVFRAQIIQERKKANLSTDGFEKIGYYRRRLQYDCKNRTFWIREATYYDLNGREIRTSDPDPSEEPVWQPFPSGTMRELEFKKACGK